MIHQSYGMEMVLTLYSFATGRLDMLVFECADSLMGNSNIESSIHVFHYQRRYIFYALTTRRDSV